MSLIVLDTDVASGILRGRVSDRLTARLAGKTWCISFVTLGELTKWTILVRGAGPCCEQVAGVVVAFRKRVIDQDRYGDG